MAIKNIVLNINRGNVAMTAPEMPSKGVNLKGAIIFLEQGGLKGNG